MAQYLKHEVRDRILDAAQHVFARQGYAASTMRMIARQAGISTGNVYRYFDSKETLFAEVLPHTFPRRLDSLIRRRVRALRGVGDVSTLAPDDPYHIVSDELLGFCVEHRLRVVVLLGKSEGSIHAAFGDKLVRSFVEMAVEHAASVGRAHRLTDTDRFALEIVYRNFVTAMVRILAELDDPEQIRCAVRRFERYHLAGLKNFFEGATP